MYYTNILEYLEETSKIFPEKIAFSDGACNKSFKTLSRESMEIGSFLSDNGYYREPIAMLMDKHPNAISAFFGIMYAGAFYIYLDTDMPISRIKLILDVINARAIIYDTKNSNKVNSLNNNITKYKFDDIISYPINQVALSHIRSNHIDTDPAYVVFTSGSSGAPKGVCASHRSVIDYTEALCEAIGFDNTTIFGNQTPLSYDAPLKEIMPTIKLGATTFFIPKQYFSFPTRLCDYLNENKINTICWVSSALSIISSLGTLSENPPKYLKLICFGSEVFPINQYKLWKEHFPGTRFFNLYGPTEATGMSTYWCADRELKYNESIPIGRPFKNTRILLLDESKNPVPQGEIGEIYVSGTCLTLGYYNDSEKTSKAYIQNPLNSSYPELVYRTGDLAKYNSFGELVFVSRKDLQIKHMGRRIELCEIENCVTSNTNVAKSCCIYDKNYKRIYLFYEGDVESVNILDVLKKHLPRYMLPYECIKLDTLPTTPNGKVDRKKLMNYIIKNSSRLPHGQADKNSI